MGIRVLFCAVALSLAGITGVDAQKFGYLNSNELLSSLPEVQAADQELTTYQEQLIGRGQEMVKKFETSYQSYMNDVNEGVLSKVQMAEREQKLGEEQQKIADFEKEVQQKIMQKRQELLEPILERIDKVIQDFGKANGYTFIFDSSSSGAILHAPDNDDITEAIKAKLGVQ